MGLSDEVARIFRNALDEGTDFFQSAAPSGSQEIIEAINRKKLSAEQILQLALRSMAHQQTWMASRYAKASIVLTNPELSAVNARRTDAVIKELFAGAQKEVMIAGYAISAKGPLLELCRSAVVSGRSVIVMAGTWKGDDEKTAFESFKAGWPAGTPLPSFYEYAEEAGLMHMKTIVVDADRALIGSANFTDRAMKFNMEMGLLVAGSVASDIAQILKKLLASGSFIQRN
jgi:phosphatidylserine/phosphatidylglycerophosphate/cardiolipin synthase-like enzyme